MATLVTYGVFVFIAIMGIVQILISNSVMKQTAANVGRNSRRIGYALIIIGIGLIILWSAGNANNGAIYKWTAIVAGIFVTIIGIYNAWQIHKSINAEHPLKEGKNAGHLAIAVLQIIFGIIAIICGL